MPEPRGQGQPDGEAEPVSRPAIPGAIARGLPSPAVPSAATQPEAGCGAGPAVEKAEGKAFDPPGRLLDSSCHLSASGVQCPGPTPPSATGGRAVSPQWPPVDQPHVQGKARPSLRHASFIHALRRWAPPLGTAETASAPQPPGSPAGAAGRAEAVGEREPLPTGGLVCPSGSSVGLAFQQRRSRPRAPAKPACPLRTETQRL